MSETALNEKPGFKITGKHVLFTMIGFFTVIITVNIVFITLAVNTFSGEEVERSYMQGLAYNEVIAERRAQDELGWTASVNQSEGRILIAVSNAEGDPVQALRLEGLLRHPTQMDYDRTLSFSEIRAGVYAAPYGAPFEGRWRVTVAAQGDTPFVLERELWQP
ncbi:MAG: FixH family protein [Pseudomonadota bacterium]